MKSSEEDLLIKKYRKMMKNGNELEEERLKLLEGFEKIKVLYGKMWEEEREDKIE